VDQEGRDNQELPDGHRLAPWQAGAKKGQKSYRPGVEVTFHHEASGKKVVTLAYAYRRVEKVSRQIGQVMGIDRFEGDRKRKIL